MQAYSLSVSPFFLPFIYTENVVEKHLNSHLVKFHKVNFSQYAFFNLCISTFGEPTRMYNQEFVNQDMTHNIPICIYSKCSESKLFLAFGNGQTLFNLTVILAKWFQFLEQQKQGGQILSRI